MRKYWVLTSVYVVVFVAVVILHESSCSSATKVERKLLKDSPTPLNGGLEKEETVTNAFKHSRRKDGVSTFFNKLLKRLSGDPPKMSSEESTGRFFIAPLIAAFPIMIAEVLTIGGMGILGPMLLLALPVILILIVPLGILAFILFL